MRILIVSLALLFWAAVLVVVGAMLGGSAGEAILQRAAVLVFVLASALAVYSLARSAMQWRAHQRAISEKLALIRK